MKTKRGKLIASMVGVVAATVALLVVFGPLGVGAGHTERTKLEVRMTATDADPLASGKTKWEQRLNEDLTLERQRTSTEVEDVSTSGLHEVLVNGLSVDMFVEVDALGFGDLNLDSRDDDTVIDMAEGDLIEVANPDGDVILSGTLQVKD